MRTSVVTIAVLMLIGWLLAALTLAQGNSPEERRAALFSPLPDTARANAVVRFGGQPVTLNRALLAPDMLAVPVNVDGQTRIARHLHTEEQPLIDGYTWIGSFVDDEWSRVVLTVTAHGFSGAVQFSGGRYTISQVAPELYAIRQPMIDRTQNDVLPIPPSATPQRQQRSTAKPASPVPLTPDGAPVIDILFAYTPISAENFGAQTLINDFVTGIALANQIARDSEANVYFNVVGTYQTLPYSDFLGAGNVLVDLFNDAPEIANVNDRRDAVGADLVTITTTFFVEDNTLPTLAGLAFVPDDEFGFEQSTGYNWMRPDVLATSTLAHELGHNLGMQHDRERLEIVDGVPAVLAVEDYAFGYIDDEFLHSVMAYPDFCDAPCAEVPFFGNPDLRYQDVHPSPAVTTVIDRPLGSALADGSRLISETASLVAAYSTCNALTLGDTVTLPTNITDFSVLQTLCDTDRLTIELIANTTYDFAEGLPVFNGSWIIEGKGATVNLPDDRFAFVPQGSSLTVRDVTITGGNPPAAPDSPDFANIADDPLPDVAFGGAFYNNGTLTLENVTLRDNQAQLGGAIYNDAQGQLTIDDSLFENNRADVDSVISNHGSLIMQDVVLRTDENFAANGNAITNYHLLTIHNGLFELPGHAGAVISHEGTTFVLSESEFVNHTGSVAISIDVASPSQAQIVNALFDSNTRDLDVSGNATLTILTSTFADAQAGPSLQVNGGIVSIGGTIFASVMGCAVTSGTLGSIGYNITVDDSCGFTQATDRLNTDPQLQPASISFGQPSRLLEPTSPALGSIPADTCNRVDLISGEVQRIQQDHRQRLRPADQPCDAGAVQNDSTIRFDPLDFTGDGLLTPIDAVIVVNRIGTDAVTADLNNDGVVNEADARLVLDELALPGQE